MKKYIIIIAALAGFTISGCRKTFLNRPPEDQYTVDGYYKTVSQVQTSTNALYSAPWFGYNTKAGWAISELASGNGRSGSSDVTAFGNFSVPNDHPEIVSAWNSLFTVVAQANALIYNLPTVPASIPRPVVNNALGEAHLMRALAYFYVVRLWGNAPIIENALDFASHPDSINNNPVTDVYKFIVKDLEFAETNCSPNVTGTGHVSSGSASALLAKVYLYMQDYDKALTEAQKVIQSGEFGLLGIDVPGFSYGDLFRIANNNNKESIIALQWLSSGGYGYGNAVQASLAFSSTITQTGDGYGVLAPSFDLQDAFTAVHDSIRRHNTLMLPNEHYPEINQATGGYTLPSSASSQGTHAQTKKYVVGSPSDNNGKSAFQSMGLNTYIIRLADVYLIAAEAILGKAAGANPAGLDTAATTSDATAIAYINKIRQRAGVTQVPPGSSISFRDIIKERRLEFAIEGDYWFDLCRLDGFNVTRHPKAIAIISKQDRGGSSGDLPWVRYGDGYYTPTDANFLFPYPASEVAIIPNLLAPPVPYVFH